MKQSRPELTSQQQEAIAHVCARVKPMLSGPRAALHRRWDLCVAGYEGTLPRKDEKRVDFDARSNLSANWIRSLVQRSVSKVYSGEPRLMAVPSSADRRDRKAARLVERVLDDHSERTKGKHRNRRLLLYAAIFGSGISKVCWNPKMGARLEAIGKNLGEVHQDDLTPYEFWVDPYADSIANAQWAASVRCHSLEKVRADNPDVADMIQPVSRDIYAQYTRGRRFSRNLASGDSVIPIAHFVSEGPDGSANQGCLILDYWERPSATFKNGLHIYAAGTSDMMVLLNDELDNPYLGLAEDGSLELPFDLVHWTPSLDTIFGTGMVEDLISLQMGTDEHLRDMEQHRRLHANAKLAVSAKSQLAGGFPNHPDGILPVDLENGPMPQYLNPAQMPPFVENLFGTMMMLGGKIAAAGEATQGQAPGRVDSGIGVEALQEADETVLAPIRMEAISSFSDIERKKMRLMQKYYDIPRTMRIVGLNRSIDVLSFRGADLTGCSDVRFIMDTGLGATKNARFARIRELIEIGQLDPMDPRTRGLIARALESGDLQELELKNDVHRTCAEDTLDALLDTAYVSGVQSQAQTDSNAIFALKPMPWIDPEVHYDVFNTFRNTPEFRQLGPNHQKVVSDYADACSAAIQMAMMQQQEMEAQQPSRGSEPAEKGSPSAPKPNKSKGDLQAANQAGGMQ